MFRVVLDEERGGRRKGIKKSVCGFSGVCGFASSEEKNGCSDRKAVSSSPCSFVNILIFVTLRSTVSLFTGLFLVQLHHLGDSSDQQKMAQGRKDVVGTRQKLDNNNNNLPYKAVGSLIFQVCLPKDPS